MADQKSNIVQRSNPANKIGYLSDANGDIIAAMAQKRVWAWGITPGTTIFVNPNYPAHLMATRASDIIAAMNAVLLGATIKGFANQPVVAIASVVQNLSLSLGQRACGARITIYDAALTYRPGYYHLALSDGAYSATAGANLGEVYVRASSAPIEVLMLSIQNGVGQASIVGMAAPTVTLVASDSATVAATATTTTVGLSAETINQRDLAH